MVFVTKSQFYLIKNTHGIFNFVQKHLKRNIDKTENTFYSIKINNKFCMQKPYDFTVAVYFISRRL